MPWLEESCWQTEPLLRRAESLDAGSDAPQQSGQFTWRSRAKFAMGDGWAWGAPRGDSRKGRCQGYPPGANGLLSQLVCASNLADLLVGIYLVSNPAWYNLEI